MSIRCSHITRRETQCKMWTRCGRTCHLHTKPGECVICLANEATYRLRCGHQFHEACISRWRDMGHNTCPTCRELIDPDVSEEEEEEEEDDNELSDEMLDDLREMIIYFLLEE